jgi:hypothetical protein
MAAVLAAHGLGCGVEQDAAGAPGAVRIAAAAWSTASAAEDPFAAQSLQLVRCSPFALRIEADWLEVDTSSCNHATLVFRFGVDTAQGDRVRGELAWAELVAPASALGTLAFATTRGGVLWMREVPIPSDAGLVTVDFELGADAPAGSALYFHVRNHGANNWQLSPLRVEHAG